MIRTIQRLLLLFTLVFCLPNTISFAQTVDFNSFGNGEKISGFDLSPLILTSSSGPNLGPAIFDSDPAGPNAGGLDGDLFVDEGNLLILQSEDFPDDFGGSDFFEMPDDEFDGGTFTFDFTIPVTLTSIDLVDINGTAAVTLVLTDGGGLTRTYAVPDEWTGDTNFATLDLTTLADQSGPGPGGDATATEMAGFNANDIDSLDITFSGSAALNNLVFVPEPLAASWLLVALVAVAARRR